MNVGGLARVGLLALIWGSGFLLIKVSLGSFSAVQLTFGRLALGALVLVIVLAIKKLRLPNKGQMWLYLAIAALFGNAIPYTLVGFAEQTVNSNLAGAINATTPLWTLLFAFLTRTENRLTATKTLGILVGFAGAVILLAPWQASSAPLVGTLACLGAAASYGVSYIFMGRYLTGKGIPPLVLSAGQLIAASGLLILASPLGGFTPVQLSPAPVAALLVLGVIGTGVAYVLNYRIITDDGPLLASTVTYLLPVVAVTMGTVFLNEELSVNLILGVLVVLAGVILSRLRPRER